MTYKINLPETARPIVPLTEEDLIFQISMMKLSDIPNDKTKDLITPRSELVYKSRLCGTMDLTSKEKGV
jgi:hypothetical protein